jgi:hypothetical protein
MDIAICLDRLVPDAEYTGSTSGDDEASYNALSWTDNRPKPTWQDILDEWGDYQAEELLRNEYRIYDFVSWYVPDLREWPGDVDFLTGLTKRLHPKNTFSYGELNETIYYETATPNAQGGLDYSNPVVKEVFVYTRDPGTGFPTYRENTITWYFSDGTLSPVTKVLEKYYVDDTITQLSELSRRRDNNLKNIIGAIIKLAIATTPGKTPNEVIEEGRGFFNNSALNRELYIEDGNMALVDDVRDDVTITWFDNDVLALCGLPTIRSFIIYQLTMGEQSS